MAKSTLQKITDRARQIRKKNKSMTWKAAVKKAGAEYRGGKISGGGKPHTSANTGNRYGPAAVPATGSKAKINRRVRGITPGSVTHKFTVGGTSWGDQVGSAARDIERMTAEVNRLLIFASGQTKQGKILVNRQISQLKQSIRQKQQFLKSASAMNARKK